MDTDEKQFEDFVRQIKLDDTPDYGHRDKLEQDILSTIAKRNHYQKDSLLQTRRIFMKSHITKLSTAAVIILGAGLLFTILYYSATPAWAIEQSIDAVSQYQAVIVEGFDSERTWREDGGLEQRRFKSWAVANEDQTQIEKYRHEVDGVCIITTNGRRTWRYAPETNTVRIENGGYVASECWLGSQFLKQLEDSHDRGTLSQWEVSYGKNTSTGEERVFLICSCPEGPPSPRSFWFEFDMISKLPVSFKQWENPSRAGPATLVVEKITYYENLPDDLFEFEIPEGAMVVEK